MEKKEFCDWTSLDLSRWLSENGLPQDICETFEAESVDGAAFLDLSEGDVKTMVKPLGHVKRVLRLISSVKSKETTSSLSASVLDDKMDTASGSLLPLSTSSPTLSARSCDYQASSDSSSRPISPVFKEGVPVNYSLPKCFSSTVMESLEKKSMEPKVRSAFTRELIVHMTSYGIRPSSNFCSAVARRIILKYPFLRDSVGSGYASWEKRLINRVYNVSKGEKKRQREDETSPLAKKRPKILDRYPPLDANDITDESTHERHMKALKAELERDKQRICVVQELMELTFGHRREFVLNHATSVEEILATYPALRQPDVIIQEMELILKKEKGFLLRHFKQEWKTKWVPVIIKFAESYTKKSKDAVRVQDYDTDKDDFDQVRAVKALSAIFTVLAKKDKEKAPLHYWLEDYDMAEAPEVCAEEIPKRNSPRIGRFIAIDCSPTYFIFIEQQVYVQVSSFAMALFIWFASHYVFNLEYSKYCKDAAMFIQEFIFDLYESDIKQKKQNYLTAVTELQKCIDPPVP